MKTLPILVGAFVLGFASTASICTPIPPVVPTPDASDATIDLCRDVSPAPTTRDSAPETGADVSCDLYCQACANLAAIKCSDGLRSNCAQAMREMVLSGDFIVTAASVQCAKTVTTIDAAKLCKGVRCK